MTGILANLSHGMYDGLCVACQSGHIPPAYQSPKTPVTPCLAHQQQQSTGTAHGRAGWNEAYSEFLPESWNSTASASVYMAVTSQPAGRLTSMHAGIPNLGYLLSSCLVTARYPGSQPSRDRPGCPRFDLPLTYLAKSCSALRGVEMASTVDVFSALHFLACQDGLDTCCPVPAGVCIRPREMTLMV